MAKTKANAEFTTAEWSGQKIYKCASCAFDTFDGVKMLQHLIDAHESEAALAALIKIESEE